ncbi:NAD(P)/FAD-dependent oxidoreductase [Candidatus Kaiserbacteria bacterium]|nr:NAD(P)/FAD-dependent oxidoreductase [Candidatus Kaiserbacteria bacterium]
MPQTGIQKVDYPVIVIGSGPAGMNAANALAFEGISVLVVDGSAPGGQANTSHSIENILGFPKGISGPELTTLLIQTGLRDGVQYLMPFRANRVRYDEASCIFTIVGEDGESLTCRAIIIATGVQLRLLKAINAAIFYRRGLEYGSPEQHRELWTRMSVGVMGGGNAAAQAAMFLSSCEGTKVHLCVRGESLKDSMSARVIKHLNDAANVDVLLRTEVLETLGDENLNFTGVRVKGPEGERVINMQSLHVHIGAKPHTDWLSGCVELDPKGYVLADSFLPASSWPLKSRPPFERETSHPGIFVAGDARFGHDVHRVQTASSDGVIAGASAYKYLEQACITPQLLEKKTA